MQFTGKIRPVGIALAGCALVLAACSNDSGGSGGQSAPKMSPAASVGAGEGQLNLITWAGYAENGSNDPKVDWVTPFEKQSGCKVNVKIGNTSDEMVQLMRSGQYDGVSASGDATLRLIYAGDVAPVNTDLVPNYATISSFLKDRAWNSVDGQMYGIPHGWGANLLMYNTDVVKGAPEFVGFRVPGQRLQGQGDGLRLADLHRRRRPVSDEDQTRTGHQGPVLADRRTAGAPPWNY
ncbi:MAG: extracellular solute-binding protein [Mycobacterium sp.]